MGSTAVGRAVSNTFDTVKNDPLRAYAAVASFGGTEAGGAVDNKFFNDPKNAAYDAGVKSDAAQNKLIDEQQVAIKGQDAIKHRDLQRARQRAMSAYRGGRSSTILTGPGGQGAIGGISGSMGGKKTLLGL